MSAIPLWRPALVFFLAGLLFVSAGEKVTGTVKDQDGEAIKDATVLVFETKKQARVDARGRFSFNEMEPGVYTLMVQSSFFGSRLEMVEIVAGRDNELSISFDVTVHEDFTVTAAPELKSISDVAQAVGALSDLDLQLKMAPSLGETLAGEPGVNATWFGPASSRPIIRGMGGERIMILEGGLGTGDASSVSADHAVSVDGMTTERIEILRGPASLRYGSSAIGGVVNIIDNRIPEYLTDAAVTGAVEIRGDSASDERTGSAMLDGSKGKIGWHLDFSSKNTHDVAVPKEGPDGGTTLENSALENLKGSFGFSYLSDRGFIGVAYTGVSSDYGVPADHEHGSDHEDSEGEEEALVTINMDQKRYELRGGLNFSDSFFKTANLRAAASDYQHLELEGDQVGTRFFNDYSELRLETNHDAFVGLTSGAIGLQYSKRDFEAIGEEAFVPPNVTEKTALYFYENLDKTNWSLTFGGRFESQSTRGSFADDQNGVIPVDLSFDGISASTGFIVGQDWDWNYSINLTHTERAPNAEELFSNGPHLATRAFEVGNPDLKGEQSNGLDFQIRKKEGRITGELNLFANRFNDFIYERFTGNEIEGLTEFQFSQEDAEFSGAELHLDTSLIHTDPHHLNLEITYDRVRARLDQGGNLPRIPPQRLLLALKYSQPAFWAESEVKFTDDQEKIAAFETATEGYTFVNIGMGYRFFMGTTIHQILMRGTNLTGELARNHSSFLKDLAPYPDRNFSLSYRMSF